MASEKDIHDLALALPPDQRAALAHELLDSLDEEPADPDVAEAWAREIERRVQEVEDGAAELVEWSVIREQLAARWRR